LINGLIKQLVGWPRPNTDLAEIGLYHPYSNGFPSGGAQCSMFLGLVLIYYRHSPAAYIIGGSYILLISFSRLYLGVHYPIDVLGGWIIAWILLALFIYTKEPLEKWLTQIGLKFCLLISLAVPFAIMLFVQTQEIYYIMGALMGVGTGTYFSLKNHLFLKNAPNLTEGIGRSVLGISILFVLILLLPGNKSFISSFTAGLFMSFAASPICRWFAFK
jgi:hypothetical protein